MAGQWIQAAKALEIVGSRYALCERLNAGLARASARLFLKDDERLEEVVLPAEFWWAGGKEALEQDWDTGDFSTWIDHAEHWQAFGVTIELDGVLEMLPFERRAIVTRELSVAADPAWVPAREVRRFVYEVTNINPVSAGRFVIDRARLGFLTARAVLAQGSHGTRHANDWSWQFREWDIPAWFWINFTSEASSSQDWESGKFTGRGIGPGNVKWVTLSGVHFLRDSLAALAPSRSSNDSDPDNPDSAKSPLSQAELERWWHKKEAVRDALSEAELMALARAAHPDHFISRDRIRELMGPRKRGPK
jgi:hypothetical protein